MSTLRWFHERWFQELGIFLTCGLAVACGGSSSHTDTAATSVTTPTGQNVAPISVNSGPNRNYADAAFASVTVCIPGTSTCHTIDDVLVDTGSFGLRILSSQLPLSLPQQNSSAGDPVVECLPFLATYTWGPVQGADVEIAGEKASSVPIQVINNTFAVPNGCSDLGLPPANSVQTLGANGILGIGLYAQDCGPACTQTGSSNPGLYYGCPSSGCQVIAEPLAQQVQNPVSLFSSDNNGVVIELPAVPSPEPSLSGSLIFGIGTESNNALGTAKIYVPDDYGNFTATYKGVPYSTSFIDSGSNGFFFLDQSTTGIPVCTNQTGFYCPDSTQSVTATTEGTNGVSGMVSFSVANANALFANGSDFVFNDLGGPAPNSFDFGLPFFLGRDVFVAIENKSTPGGSGPYWAY